MKKVILLLGVVVIMASCDKVLDKLGTFSFTRTGEFIIPMSSQVGTPLIFNTPDINTTYIQEFESNGLSTDNVEYIKLTKMTVRIKLPVGQNFNFLKSVVLSINAQGLTEKEIASKINLADDNVAQMEIDVTSEDVKPFIMEEKFQLKLTAELDQAITQDITVEATPTFEVKGNLL